MPAAVDKYYEEVKRDNPSYSEEQAWATAWSIYCKHKNPGSDHCQKPPSEYLKGKTAMTGRLAAMYLAQEDLFRDRERAYLHISNGGLTLILQELLNAEYGSTYRLRYEMSSMGQTSAGEFPLPAMAAGWLNAVLMKLGPEIMESEQGRSFNPFTSLDMESDGVPHPKVEPVAYESDKTAFTFPTPKALKEYLREHPKADRSKHEVAKPDHGKDEDHGHGDDHGKKDDGPDFSTLGKKLSDAVTGWGSKAIKSIKEAPAAAKKFVEDEGHRRKVLMGAHKKVEHLFELPKALVDTAREEVHEFKDAGAALGKAMKGEKLSKHDKHALKTVGTHLAITAAATAFAATSLGAGAAIFGKAMAKHVALKAVSNVLAKGHMLEEVAHVGAGFKSLLEKFAAKDETKTDPMEGFAKLVLAAVGKEMDGLTPKAIGEALEAFEDGDKNKVQPMGGAKKASLAERVATVYLEAHPED